MFINVNELKGLLIDISSFDVTTDNEWCELSNLIPCAFIYDKLDEPRIRKLREKTSNSSVFIKSKDYFFIPYFPEIREALRILNISRCNVAYVTSKMPRIRGVLNCGEQVGTILVSSQLEIDFSYTGYIPDFVLPNIDSIKNVLRGEVKGYVAEVVLTRLGNKSLSDRGYAIKTNLEVDGKKCLVLGGGRYYEIPHVNRKVHQFSHRLYKSKRDESQNEFFVGLLSGMLKYIDSDYKKVHGVTRVPPRPNERDRLGPIVKDSCKVVGLRDMTDCLICIETYPPQKGLNHVARTENVKGKFLVNGDVYGKHIVLVDDVLTTGATVKECTKMLLEQGASDVTIVVFGINQFKPEWGSNYIFKCLDYPKCDGEMVLRINSRDQSAFFGCSNYKKGCRKKLSYEDGWEMFNRIVSKNYDAFLMDIEEGKITF